jgi:transposase-like protein
LRGISTRQTGRVVTILTGEVVSATTVSKLTRDLDKAARQFHEARLSDDYAYLFLDGVSCGCGVRGGVSECTCWWPTECGAIRDAICHLSRG